jgi:protein tyrosine phosphatase
MLWEHDSQVVVMLTKFTEQKAVRASIYWPVVLGSPMQFGELSVVLGYEINIGAVDIRIFQLSDGVLTRSVAHLHFTGWPDFGIPSNTAEVLDLAQLTNFFHERFGKCFFFF